MRYINSDILPPFLKPVRWVGSSKRTIDAMPGDSRREAGFEIGQVQQGKMPSDFKPMPSIGPGVYEIRVRTGIEYRVIYIAKYAEAVYVLHVFEKRTRKTSQTDIDQAKRGLAEAHQWRKADGLA